MLSPSRILLIDNHADNRALLARTLFRKFPRVSVQECQDIAVAVGEAALQKFDAIVLHRTNDADAVELVEAIRKTNPKVPILVVSGVDRSAAVIKAGANGFLNFDEWLRVGTVIAEILAAEDAAASKPPFVAPREGVGLGKVAATPVRRKTRDPFGHSGN